MSITESLERIRQEIPTLTEEELSYLLISLHVLAADVSTHLFAVRVDRLIKE